MSNRQFLPRLKPWVSLSNVMKYTVSDEEVRKYFPSSSHGYKREYYRWNYAWHDSVGYREGDHFSVMRDGQNKIIFIKTSPNCWEIDPSYDPGCAQRVYRLKGTTLYSNGGGYWENVYTDDDVEDIILKDDYWWFR